MGGERRIHYALDSLLRALEQIGSPHQNVQTIVIAGTNGKGTTALLVSHALHRGGYKVATFLSPHLQCVTERFLLGMQTARLQELETLADEYVGVAQEHHLTYFEFLTLLFFVWAKKQEANLLVLEVGLGGRLDATNVTRPIACAVTSIDLDHMAYLGNTLEEILLEKLAVVPVGGTLVSGIVQDSLKEKTRAWCAQQNVRCIDAQTSALPFSWKHSNPKFQENARTAYVLLRETFPALPQTTIEEAFSSSHFPGRFETVSLQPKVVLSGDHNPAGIESLMKTLDQTPGEKFHILCAFSPDKPYQEMFHRLKTRAARIALCPLANARGKYPDDYRKMATHYFETSEAALRWVLSECPPQETCLVTGSLYLVGEIGPHFRKKVGFTR